MNGRVRIGVAFEVVVDDRTKTEDEVTRRFFYTTKMGLTFNDKTCEMNVSITAQYASSHSKSCGWFA